MSIKGKKILLGVCGGIAAYKIATLIRILKKQGAEVKVIITESAKDFITPLTLSTLSENPVLSTFFEKNSGQWHNHVDLGLWCDLFVVAPATASTMAKCANGFADNLLVTTYLSCRSKVVFAPAMDLDMWLHPSTQKNIDLLKSYGNLIIDPSEGQLASGLVGKGRMAEPEMIADVISYILLKNSDLEGKNILITAGPTQEDLDPVRFISNHSSGKMGFEIAKVLSFSGANVTVIAGPNSIKKSSQIKVIDVRTAEEMLEATKKYHLEADVVVFSAAVADYRPAIKAEQKIKKNDSELHIDLVKNPDIAYEMGKQKKENQVHVGFALETNNELENAQLKLKKKNFDLIVLNSLQDKGAGFRYDTNKITIVSNLGSTVEYELKSKEEVANDIKYEIINYINKKSIC